mgnify:CR=1 FL=1
MKLQRRHWIGAGVALAAAGTGAWWSNRRHQPLPVPTEAEAAFWEVSFEGPNGEAVRVADHRGQPLLVNFWATWCPPCVRELPMLDAFSARQNQHGIQVIGLAVDKPEAVQRFLGRTPLRFPVALAVEGGLGLTRSLGNLQGGLPFTVLLGEDGMVQQRKIGELTTEDLASWSAKG